ncbi:hypothetical protein LOD99_11423 [Oopsacas minuta]|uniref:Uncharacterized protein n=1 Tax=Oopsacas minuta TaxID=111878 RepID=A0AAV7K2Z5_9METZ|nr:hypothetical protein LOD99_11423 [Oopsacas minuta]
MAVYIAGVTGAVVVGAITAPLVLPAIGFGSTGVIAGSIAASMQGPAVAAGSWFALGQSIGATVTTIGAMKAGGAVGGAVGTVVAATARVLVKF